MEKSDGSSLPFPGCEPLVRSPKSVKPLIRPSTHDVPINGWVPTWNTPIPRVPLRSPCLPDLQCFNCHFFTFTGQRMFVGNRRAKIERLVIPSPYVVLKSDNMQSLFQNWDAPKSQLLKSSFPHANGNKVGPPISGESRINLSDFSRVASQPQADKLTEPLGVDLLVIL